jgi:hypothetical protein
MIQKRNATPADGQPDAVVTITAGKLVSLEVLPGPVLTEYSPARQ